MPVTRPGMVAAGTLAELLAPVTKREYLFLFLLLSHLPSLLISSTKHDWKKKSVK